MTTQYLKFPDEATAIAVLSDFRTVFNGIEQWVPSSLTHELIDIGTLYEPTGVTLHTDFGDAPEMQPIPGYHINFIGELPAAAVPYLIHPVSPRSVMLGE